MVGGSDYEGAEGAGGEFHEVDGDDAPCPLHAELLEKGGGDDGMARGEGVGVEEGTADDADEDDGEAASEDLGGVADYGAASHCAQVSNDLGNSYCVGAEVKLVRQHGWIEILGPVGLEGGK